MHRFILRLYILTMRAFLASFVVLLVLLDFGNTADDSIKTSLNVSSDLDIFQPSHPQTTTPQTTTPQTTTPQTTTPQTIENTTSPDNTTSKAWAGYIGAGVAVVFFGSNLVPVKKFDTGDGVFFQWVLCIAIWMTGLIVNCIQNFPKFHGLAMLGGFLWSTGSMCVVPIIKTIGLGLGMLIWGSFNLLSGWASGRFGWFGLNPEIPNNLTYNYISIGLAMASTICWLFVKSDTTGPGRKRADTEEERLLNSSDDIEIILSDPPPTPPPSDDDDASWTDKLSFRNKRIVGCLLCVFSGILYGVSFAPVIHIKDNPDKFPGASQKDLDYVFAHFCGILASTSMYFIIYCMIKKNRPKIYPRVILPGIVSGWMWGAAEIGWFIANEYLSEAVSFPIITTGPGLIASLWGVLVFKEIHGRRNFAIMGVAYVLTITAAVFAGLSKK